MKLTTIMPWEEWVEFEKEFNERTGLNCCLIDEDGVRITAYHKWATPLCSAIRGDKTARAVICDQSRNLLHDKSAKDEGMVIANCAAGLTVACVAVRSGGKVVGLVGGCGKLLGGASVDTLAVAAPTGLSTQKIQGLCGEIGVLQPQEVRALGRYLLGRLAQVIDNQPSGQGGSK